MLLLPQQSDVSPQHRSEAVSRRRQRIHRRIQGISDRPIGLPSIPEALFRRRFALWLDAWRGRGTSRESRAYYIETVRREHWDGASEYARYLAKPEDDPVPDLPLSGQCRV